MGKSCSYLNVDELKPVQRERLKMQEKERQMMEEVRGFEL